MEALKVGRIVHYVAYGTPGGEYPKICRAAVVTEVQASQPGEAMRASVMVANPSGLFFNQNLLESPVSLETSAEQLKGGTWHDPRSCRR